jgi:hypothetical protein
LLAWLRPSVECSFKLLGFSLAGTTGKLDKVFTCNAEDFDILTSLKFKEYLNLCRNDTALMTKELIPALEREVTEKPDDPKALHLLRFVFETGNQGLLTDNILRILSIKKSELTKIKREEEEQLLTEGVFLNSQTDSKELIEAYSTLSTKKSSIRSIDPKKHLWFKYVALLKIVYDEDMDSNFRDNIENFLYSHESKTITIIKDYVDNSSVSSVNKIGLINLGLVGIAMEEHKIDITEVLISSLMIQNEDDEEEDSSIQSLKELLVLSLRCLQEKLSSMSAYFSFVNKGSSFFGIQHTRWAYFIWILTMGKADKADNIQTLIQLANVEIKRIMSQRLSEAFETSTVYLKEIKSFVQPKSSKYLEFCRAARIEDTYFGKLMGPLQCHLSTFLAKSYDYDLDDVVSALLKHDSKIGSVIETYLSNFDQLVALDKVLLGIARVARSLREAIAQVTEKPKPTLVNASLAQLYKKQGNFAELKKSIANLDALLNEHLEVVETVCKEKRRFFESGNHDVAGFLRSENTKLGDLLIGVGNGTCLLGEISEALIDTRNKMFQATLEALPNSEFVFSKVVSLVDMSEEDCLGLLELEGQQPQGRKRNIVQRLLMNHFLVDLNGEIHFDKEILAQSLFRNIIGKLGKVILKPIIHIEDVKAKPQQVTDLDTLVLEAMKKLTDRSELIEASSKIQKEIVLLFETAKKLKHQDKISSSLRQMTHLCAREVQTSSTCNLNTKLTTLIPIEPTSELADYLTFFDAIPLSLLSSLLKVQQALAYRECKSLLAGDPANNDSRRLEEVIKDNRVAKEFLLFAVVELASQVVKVIDKCRKERVDLEKVRFVEVPLEEEVREVVHSWLSRLNHKDNFLLTDAIWIIDTMEKFRAFITN